MVNKNISPLGKGLNALLPLSGNESRLSLKDTDGGKIDAPYFLCPIDFITPNPYQPRKTFLDDELKSLSLSIREKGILQPLVVRRLDSNRYELIAGERRLRAAQMAELEKVPALVKDIAIADRLELALIENIQREGLNPLEEAEAYAKLIDEFGMTQELVAKRVGKKRSTVANSVRLLQLPDYATKSLASGLISSGHARVLLGLPNNEKIKTLHDLIINKKLSVREAESWAKKEKTTKAQTRAPRKSSKMMPAIPDSYCKSLNKSLGAFLGSKSNICQNGTRGKIEIEYYSTDDLERLLSLIVRENK